MKTLFDQALGRLFPRGSFLQQQVWTVLALVLLAAVGSGLIHYATSSGIGLRDDTFSYFTAAEGLASGAGYGRIDGAGNFRPLTNFPPGYSALLAGTTVMGLDLEAGARLLAGLSHSAIVLLVGLSLLWASRSRQLALLGATLALFSPNLLEILAWARAEGPYLSLALGCLLTLASYVEKDRERWLLASGCLAALALLTRYVGVTIVIAGGIAMPLLSGWSKRKGVWRPLAFAGVALTPTMAFIARNSLIAGSATNRPAPYWHPPSAAKLLEGSRTVLEWILPARWVASMGSWGWIPTLALLGLVTLVPFLTWRLGDTARAKSIARLGTVHGLHAAVYSFTLLISVSAFDRLTPLNARVLSPVQLSVGVMVLLFAGLAYRQASLRGKAILLVIASLALVGQVDRGWKQAKALAEEGLGFNSDSWRASQTMEYMRNEIPDVPIFTNNVPALYFLANRHASFIPTRVDPASGEAREEYDHRLKEMGRAFRLENAYMVIVGPGPRGRYPREQMAEMTEDLILIAEFGDGLIYRYDR